MNKKRAIVIAIALVLFVGLCTFVFLKTDIFKSDENEIKENTNENNTDKENNTDVKDDEEDSSNKGEGGNGSNNTSSSVVIDNSVSKAEVAVVKAENTYEKEDYDAAMKLVKVLKNNKAKEALLERLEEIAKVHDLAQVINELTNKISEAEDKEDIDEAREYRANSKIAEEVEALVDSVGKETLLAALEELTAILDDTTAPTVEGVKDKDVAKEVNVTVKEENVTLLLNGKTVTKEELSKITTEGEYKLEVLDEAYNLAVVTFAIDTTAPIVEGVKDKDVAKEVSVIVKEENVTTLLNDKTVTKEELSKITNEGEYKLEVTDAVGNTNTITFAIDTTAPIVEGVKDKDVAKEVSVTIKEENVTILLNGKSVTKEELSKINVEGEYKLEVTDAVGNRNTITFVIDTTAPVITDVDKDSYVYDGVGVKPNTEATDVNAVKLTKDGVEVENYVLGNAIINVGKYELTLTDKAGNSSAKSFEITKADTTIVFTLPTDLTYSAEAKVVKAVLMRNDVQVKELTVSYTDLLDVEASPMNAGEYIASAVFAGDENHNASSGETRFEITKATPNVEWEFDSNYTGDVKTIVAKLMRGETLVQNLTVLVEDTMGNPTVLQSFGEYVAKVDYAGDENHNAVSATKEISITIEIDSDDKLVNAIKNQADGQIWTIKEGTYTLNPGTDIYESQTGWFFPIVANDLNIVGEGDVTIKAGTDVANGAWASQNFVTIWGNNVTIDNVTLISQVDPSSDMPNKVVEILGDNTVLLNITTESNMDEETDVEDFSGTIYIGASGINTVLHNVTLNKGRISFSGADSSNHTLLINVLVDYAGSPRESQSLMYPVYNPNNSPVSVDRFKVNVSNAIAPQLNEVIAHLPANTELTLKDGEYVLDNDNDDTVESGHLYITNDITLKGESHNTVISVNAGGLTGQAGVYVEANVTISNLKVVMNTTNTSLAALKASGNSLSVVDRLKLENVAVVNNGGKHGINIHGVTNAVLNRVTVSTDNDSLKGVALAVASSNVTVLNSDLILGTWGNIGIMYNASNPSAYPNPSTVTIGTGNTNISVVYAEVPSAGNNFVFQDGQTWNETFNATANQNVYVVQQ